MNLFTEFLRYLVSLFDMEKLVLFFVLLISLTVFFTLFANYSDRRKNRLKI